MESLHSYCLDMWMNYIHCISIEAIILGDLFVLCHCSSFYSQVAFLVAPS